MKFQNHSNTWIGNDRNSQDIESKLVSYRQNLDEINNHISKITEPVLQQILKERKLAIQQHE